MTAGGLQLGALVVAVFALCGTAQEESGSRLYCSACRAVVDELNYSISQVDPKKTINVGSFRLNPDGSMMDKKVPLARSEAHLTELLDEVCTSMSDYAIFTNPKTHEKTYKRFAPRKNSGSDFPDIKAFRFDGPHGSDSLKFACESFVEEHGDDIISLFAQGADRVGDRLCVEMSGHCKDDKSHSEL